MKSSSQAQQLSYSAAVLCAVLSLPSILLGGIAKSTGNPFNPLAVRFNNFDSADGTDWVNGTDYGIALTTGEQTKQVLPLVLNYLTPQVSDAT